MWLGHLILLKERTEGAGIGGVATPTHELYGGAKGDLPNPGKRLGQHLPRRPATVANGRGKGWKGRVGRDGGAGIGRVETPPHEWALRGCVGK